MKAVIIVSHPDHTIKRVIGPFDSGQAASDYSATLEWSALRTILLLESPECKDPMCGHDDCQDSPPRYASPGETFS